MTGDGRDDIVRLHDNDLLAIELQAAPGASFGHHFVGDAGDAGDLVGNASLGVDQRAEFIHYFHSIMKVYGNLRDFSGKVVGARGFYIYNCIH